MSDIILHIRNNRGQNAEGASSGDFTLPVTEEEIAERIGLNEDGQNYSVYSAEVPVETEDIGIYGIQQLSKILLELTDKIPVQDIWLIRHAWFHDIAELYYESYKIKCYRDMEEFQEAARQMVANILPEGDIVEVIKKCISYERMAVY